MMNEEIQKKFIQFKMIEDHIQELSKQHDLFEKQQQELNNTLEALEQLPTLKKGQEIMIPLAAGILIKGTISDPSSLFVNVGSDVTMTKTIEEGRGMVKEQLDQISEYEKQVTEQLVRLSEMADKVNEELMELQKEE
jgi:prefoldin alpha subunit